MVANPSTNVLQFPSHEEGSRRLLLEIQRLGAGGEWTGSQAELAAGLNVSTKTVSRWIGQVRGTYLTTTGRTEKLTYRVLAVPAGRPEAPMTTAEAMSEASDICDITMSEASDITPEADVRSFGHQEPIQMRASRAGAPLSSSSSSRFGHPASDTTDPSMSEEDGGGDGGNGGSTGTVTLTPILEIHAVYHVQASGETAEQWSLLDEEGRRFVSRKVRLFPSQKDRDNPPPAWFAAVVQSALEDQQARRMVARVAPAELMALLDQVSDVEPEVAPLLTTTPTSGPLSIVERALLEERITEALMWPFRSR